MSFLRDSQCVRTCIQCAVLFVSFFILSGCQDKSDYAYLMRHPDALEKAVMGCEANMLKATQQNSHCKMVNYAANHFTMLLFEQQQDPQTFGRKILDAEYVCVKAKNELTTIQASIRSLKKNSGVSVELAGLQIKLNQAKENYFQKAEEVEILLAVVGLSRPE